MKFEVVLTVWKDGLFKLRERLEVNNTDELVEQFATMVDKAVDKIDEDERKRYEIDDDIPF